MIIKISDKRPRDFQFCLKADQLKKSEGTLEGQPDGEGLQVTGSIQRKNENTVHVSLHLSGTMLYPCARCLQPVPVSTAIDYEDDFEWAEGQDTGDLVPFVEECLFIHEPYRVLCDETCRGLCPGCGVNLNEGQCQCSREPEIDPRLAALKNLF